MKQLKLILLSLFSIQPFMHAAEQKRQQKQDFYTGIFCILIVYQTKAIQNLHYKPQGAVESLLLAEVRKDELCAELPMHSFAKLRQYAPTVYNVHIERLSKFYNWLPEHQLIVFKNIFDRVPKMLELAHQSQPYVWVSNSIEPWEERCSQNYLEALKRAHKTHKKPDLPLLDSWTIQEPKTKNRPHCTAVNIPKEQDTQKPSGYGCSIM